MKTIFLSLLMGIAISLPTAAQNQTALANDIGKILQSTNPQQPVSKVLPIIFLKLKATYKLQEPGKEIEQSLIKAIELRRTYKASASESPLVYKAYDYAMAGMLTAERSPKKPTNAACDGAKRQLKTALDEYDRALKAYQRCLNGSSFSMGMETRAMDSMLGSSVPGMDLESATGNCDNQLRDIRSALDRIKRWSSVVKFACKI